MKYTVDQLLSSPVRRLTASGDGPTLDTALDAAVEKLRRIMAATIQDEEGRVASIRIEAQVRMVPVDVPPSEMIKCDGCGIEVPEDAIRGGWQENIWFCVSCRGE